MKRTWKRREEGGSSSNASEEACSAHRRCTCLWCEGPDALAASRTPPRFAIGTAVECKLDAGWQGGTVVAHHYFEQGAGWKEPAPYQVQLIDDTLIFAPADTDRVVRLAPVRAPQCSHPSILMPPNNDSSSPPSSPLD